MTSILKAVGKSAREGQYSIHFYYQAPGGGRDDGLPSWDVPARSWEHMQEVVRVFNKGEKA